MAAGREEGEFRGLVFMDSDVYKWLEARRLGGLATRGDEVIGLIEAAQEDDGYLNSYYQVAKPGPRWENLAWDHEMYCAGHLIQAAVAHARVRGDDRLLNVARRFADLLRAGVRRPGHAGPSGDRDGAGGALPLTGERALSRAVPGARSTAAASRRCSRRASARATSRTACRCASRTRSRATPCARCTSTRASPTSIWRRASAALLEAMERQWRDMAGRKAYVTGGVGAHHMDEAFGDAYELPPDRCYGETCAAIASIMWNWRMLLVTGEARYADLLERTLYNGFIAGLALDGSGYSYVNPLHVRDDHRDPVRARRAPPAVVRVRVLPAERDAAAGLAPALPGVRGRRRAADPPVHGRDAARRDDADRLPVGRDGGDRERAGRWRCASRPGGRRGWTARSSRPGYARVGPGA